VGDLSLVSLVTSGFKNSRLEVLPHRGEDLFLTLGPDEGLGVVVPVVSPLLDATGELGDAAMHAALEVLGGQGSRTSARPGSSRTSTSG
jgi:hypothetical protein